VADTQTLAQWNEDDGWSAIGDGVDSGICLELKVIDI